MAVARPNVSDEVVLTAIGETDRVRCYNRALIDNDETLTIIQGLLDNVKSESEPKKFFLLLSWWISVWRPPDMRGITRPRVPSDIIFSASNDGFAYPGVAHRDGMNLAIRGPALLAKMEVIRCLVCEIIDYLGYRIYGRKQSAKSKSIAPAWAIEWEHI